MDEIKKEIRVKFSSLSPELREKYEKIKNKIKIRTGESSLVSDMKKAIQNEKLKDFTVKVQNEEFKVHKLLLAARSPVFSGMIENNIDAECLILTDISVEIFREIFNFIYTDELPVTDDINFSHLYAAAGRLKIDNLKNFSAEKIQVNPKNAMEMLTLANKYESEYLQRKTFGEIKKILGDESISFDLVNQPEKLEKLLEIKKMKDEYEAMMCNDVITRC